MSKSLQCKLQYAQRVTPGTARLFCPVKDAICNVFLPALLCEEELDKNLGRLLAFGTRFAGLALYKPLSTAKSSLIASAKRALRLVDGLLSKGGFTMDKHSK